MPLSIIVAMSQNGVIGKNNQLPWHISEDLKRFKALTMGHPILMGRKTFESIGKPLPGRTNIVITRNKNFTAEGVSVCHSLNEALASVSGDCFVIGGAEIYKQALPHAQKIILTRIEQYVDGDTFWTDIPWKEFNLLEESPLFHSTPQKIPYRFLSYQRKKT